MSKDTMPNEIMVHLIYHNRQTEALLNDLSLASGAVRPKSSKSMMRIGFTLFGQHFPCWPQTQRRVLLRSLQIFSDLKSGFPQKLADHAVSGYRRKYIGTSPKDIYGERIGLYRHAKEFSPRWYVSTNEDYEKKVQILEWACEVMDIEYGKDFIARMPW